MRSFKTEATTKPFFFAIDNLTSKYLIYNRLKDWTNYFLIQW